VGRRRLVDRRGPYGRRLVDRSSVDGREKIHAMAMTTWLQAVSREEIDALRREPDRVRSMDNEPSFSTHFAASINYFVAGNAYPAEDDHPLWPMLYGAESVACASLENGEFGLVAPETTRRLADVLESLDASTVTARVEAAQLADLVDDEELYDLELIEPEIAPATITGDLRRLVAFYGQVAAADLGVVAYTA
jgi:hypothetical protein